MAPDARASEPPRRKIKAIWLGRQAYLPVHALQERLFLARQREEIGDTILFLEHEPVVTLGRGAKPEHLLLTEEELRRRGVELVSTGRGGDVTLHAPGQLVTYPILSLAPDRQDVRRYVKDLTRVMQGVVSEHGIGAGEFERYVGLWVDRDSPERWPGATAALPAKIGAIGVRISRWVTMHGFALNLDVDLERFGMIVPCGIREYPVTSVATLTGKAVDVQRAAERAFRLFGEVFDAEMGGLEERDLAEV